MVREEPIINKCCYILPLRLCLQTWAYFKIAADIGVGLLAAMLITLIYHFTQNDLSLTVGMYGFFFIILSLVIDIGFMILLSVGVWKKSIKMLNVFFYYSIYMIFVEVLICVGAVVWIAYSTDGVSGGSGITIFVVIGELLNLALDMSILVTVKSEIIKLRNKEQYDFVKMPAIEAEVDLEPGSFDDDTE